MVPGNYTVKVASFKRWKTTLYTLFTQANEDCWKATVNENKRQKCSCLDYGGLDGLCVRR